MLKIPSDWSVCSVIVFIMEGRVKILFNISFQRERFSCGYKIISFSGYLNLKYVYKVEPNANKNCRVSQFLIFLL